MMDIYIICKQIAHDSYKPHKAFLTEAEAIEFVNANQQPEDVVCEEWNILPSVLILGGVR